MIFILLILSCNLMSAEIASCSSYEDLDTIKQKIVTIVGEAIKAT